jgi:hypothetical protein
MKAPIWEKDDIYLKNSLSDNMLDMRLRSASLAVAHASFTVIDDIYQFMYIFITARKRKTD